MILFKGLNVIRPSKHFIQAIHVWIFLIVNCSVYDTDATLNAIDCQWVDIVKFINFNTHNGYLLSVTLNPDYEEIEVKTSNVATYNLVLSIPQINHYRVSGCVLSSVVTS